MTLSCFDAVGPLKAVVATLIIIFIIIKKKIGNARPGEGDCHPINTLNIATLNIV